ncbi:MAG TPA: hypothetical protein VF318_05800, partial [Dehalococcoidales bacterium]
VLAGLVVVAGAVVEGAVVAVDVAGLEVFAGGVVDGAVVVVELLLQPTMSIEITNRIARIMKPRFIFFLLYFY